MYIRAKTVQYKQFLLRGEKVGILYMQGLIPSCSLVSTKDKIDTPPKTVHNTGIRMLYSLMI